MEKLKINRVSGLMFIDIDIWSVREKRFRAMSVLLDTGASVTTISDFILSSLGYTDESDAIKVTTASGTVLMRKKIIHKIKIGFKELSDVEVYAHDFPDACFSDGVLGMNVLGQFNFTINLDENIMRLASRYNTEDNL